MDKQPPPALATEINSPETDEDGFLRNPEDWSPTLAESMASATGLTLTDAHWALIHLVRNFYLDTQLHLTNRALIKQIGKTLSQDKANSIYVLSLFPDAPARTLARLAGLPKPPFCF